MSSSDSDRIDTTARALEAALARIGEPITEAQAREIAALADCECKEGMFRGGHGGHSRACVRVRAPARGHLPRCAHTRAPKCPHEETNLAGAGGKPAASSNAAEVSGGRVARGRRVASARREWAASDVLNIRHLKTSNFWEKSGGGDNQMGYK
jgi:hypothetical protein